MPWLLCEAKCFGNGVPLERRLYWSSVVEAKLFCPVCEELQPPSAIENLPPEELKRLEENIKQRMLSDLDSGNSQWFLCEGLHFQEPPQKRLFWSSEGYDKADPSCPRCGGCCPAEFMDLNPEEQDKLREFIRIHVVV